MIGPKTADGVDFTLGMPLWFPAAAGRSAFRQETSPDCMEVDFAGDPDDEPDIPPRWFLTTIGGAGIFGVDLGGLYSSEEAMRAAQIRRLAAERDAIQARIDEEKRKAGEPMSKKSEHRHESDSDRKAWQDKAWERRHDQFVAARREHGVEFFAAMTPFQEWSLLWVLAESWDESSFAIVFEEREGREYFCAIHGRTLYLEFSAAQWLARMYRERTGKPIRMPVDPGNPTRKPLVDLLFPRDDGER